MWPFSSRKSPRTAPARRLAYRPCLEVLEDRSCPSSGALDPTFNPSGNPPGTALAAPPSSVGSLETSVLVQPSGKIVTTGQSQYYNNKAGYIWGFSAACFNPNGSLDTTFGSGGTALITA